MPKRREVPLHCNVMSLSILGRTCSSFKALQLAFFDREILRDPLYDSCRVLDVHSRLLEPSSRQLIVQIDQTRVLSAVDARAVGAVQSLVQFAHARGLGRSSREEVGAEAVPWACRWGEPGRLAVGGRECDEEEEAECNSGDDGESHGCSGEVGRGGQLGYVKKGGEAGRAASTGGSDEIVLRMEHLIFAASKEPGKEDRAITTRT